MMKLEPPSILITTGNVAGNDGLSDAGRALEEMISAFAVAVPIMFGI